MKPLYHFQEHAVEWLTYHFRAILALDMGLGKSRCILELTTRCPGVCQILVVCPASLKINWYRESQKWTPGRSVQVIRGQTPIKFEADTVIINYDILRFHVGELCRGWDLVAFDEAHMLKNYEAQRSEIAYKYLIRAPRVIFATGSPMVNRPVELWPMLRAIDRKVSGTYEQFTQRYCGGHHDQHGRWWAFGATNLDELAARIEPVMLRRTKAEVLPELPPKTRTVIEIDGLPSSIEELNAVCSDFRAELRRPGGSCRTASKASGHFDAELARIRREDGLRKAPAVVSHVKMLLDGGEKVLVFAWHRDVAFALADGLAGWHCDTPVIGGMNPKLAQEIRDDFQVNPKKRVMVGNIQAMGEGHTLTAATAVVFAELAHSPLAMAQAEDRAYRIGLDHPVSIQYIVAAGSIDSRLGPALIRKLENFDRVINQVRPADDFDAAAILLGGIEV